LHDHLPVCASGGFYAGASGGLGWALPAAVGVALAEPTRKVICIVGDGSGLFSIQGLWTAAQLRLPITYVVFNNRGYGALKSFGRMLGIADAPGQDLPGVDFVALATGFGCRARRLDKAADLDAALREAFGSAETWLIDVQVGALQQDLY
jgi:benzoylformate decarboxylase